LEVLTICTENVVLKRVIAPYYRIFSGAGRKGLTGNNVGYFKNQGGDPGLTLKERWEGGFHLLTKVHVTLY